MFFETLTGSHAMQGLQGDLPTFLVIVATAAAFLAVLCGERLLPHNSHRSTLRAKTASEQSSPNGEKNSRNLCEVMKRNAGFMAQPLR
jgi:hypothetical protein